MVKKIGIAFLVLVAVLLVVIATRPAEFRLERSAKIAAPPAVVFSQINDFHQWGAWSPWEKMDPNMKKTFDGPAAGTGAVYSWVGNDEVGEGRMTIVESKPSERIGIKLEFLKPWAATNQTTFTLAPTGEGTEVQWAMEGQHDFVGKAFCMFVDMDAMVGKDFERGLASLKAVSEAEAQKRKAEAEAAAAATPPAEAPADAPPTR